MDVIKTRFHPLSVLGLPYYFLSSMVPRFVSSCRNARGTTSSRANADYWPWGEFKTDLESVVRAAEDAQNNGGDIDWARVGRIGLRVAQGALFVLSVPLIGIATLNIIGFTAGGVLAGSAAAGLQSAIYGGATGGLFSVLQSIGATATLEAPVIMAGFSAATRWFGLGGSGNEPSGGSGGGGSPPNSGRRPTPPTTSGDEPASSPSNSGIADASPLQPRVTTEAETEVESRTVRYGPCRLPTNADSTARARKVVDDLNVNAVRGSDVVSARGIEG
ncbi:hypothetical protein FA13DRAFT_1711236 [Coprinellus micaceus]|uniref:Uncharacterized protein n=1 Tax=Coprinellus micaceus TaxID=71717 RepID=A0A4Y7T505_COPMI|nr:hypothetical protein FA13DRAFT_1711236 [Coprinellus micaceus]